MSDERLNVSKYERVFPAKHVLFEQGEAGTRMYVIRRGRVLIYRSIEGEELNIVTLGPGEFFGEMALLEDQPRSASARTETACVLIEIDEPTFEEMIQDNAEIGVRMLRKLSGRVRELDRKIQRLTLERGVGRALEMVRDLAKGGRVLRAQLIDELTQDGGCARYEAELLVHDLMRAKVLLVDGQHVVVKDQKALDQFSRFLELREKYEGAANEGSDVARRMGRLIRALDKTPDEDQKSQTVIARHYREYLEMKQRFGD